LFANKNWKSAKQAFEALQHDYAGTAVLAANAETLKKRLEDIDESILANQAISLDLGGGIKMELMPIPAGEFEMGSNDGEANEKPVHKVKISRAFYMGKYVVTQAQYEKVTGKNPCALKGENLPLDIVNWSDAIEFCKKLSKLSGKNVRLPTEAEWEYACRAGTKTKYYTGDNEAALEQAAWYDKNSGRQPHPVGLKKPNAWGLYDMHGGVWQYCQDSYGADYYSKSAAEDPEGPTGSDCVMRGGSRGKNAKECRSAARGALWKSTGVRIGACYDAYGFRVVVTISKTH
jgi:formylglycine-generating enzyme required for sulfatase activity